MNIECFPCQLVTWDKSFDLGRDLARKIKSSGYRPDLVVAIGRGGFVPARVVCDYLLHKNLACMKIEHWGMAASKGDCALIRHPLSVDVENLKVLIIDDVTDTGDTLDVASSYIREKMASEIRTGVLQHKLSSRFLPDYFAELISEWRWVIYPWAAHEDLVGFLDRVLAPEFASPEQIFSALNSCYSMDLPLQSFSDALADLVDLGRAERSGDMYRKAMKHIG